MTVTVKLDTLLEEQLRRRAAMAGCSTSEVIRSALRSYLETPETAPAPSAFSLGQGLFGRHRGEPGLAQGRKRQLADLWADKHAGRRV